MNRWAFPLVLVALVVLAGCSERPPPAQPAAVPQAPGNAAAGKVLAERSCTGCHRADGLGAAPGIPHLAGQSEAYLAWAMREYSEGHRAHAVLKDMTPKLAAADVANVAAYYAGLTASARAATQPPAAPTPYERGERNAKACASCHGADGNSAVAGTPSLAGQHFRYLLAALSAYHHGDRRAPAVASMLRGAGQIDLESIALYFASQTPAQRGTPTVGDVAAGRALTLPCSGCHGLRGLGSDTATPTLAAQEPTYLYTSLKAYGSSRRHAVMEELLGKLTDKDLRDIAAYYAAQSSRPAERGRDQISQLTAKCDRCHGATAGDAAVPVPRLAGQDRDYLVMALRAYRDDRRESSAMHKMSLPFGEAVLDALATHYASQTGSR